MAKTLCRVAGGGKPLKGNAEAGDVLAGKTFSNKQSNALTGTMPNNGTNKNAVSVGGGSGSLWAYMPYGYYDNYNNSGNAWINITNDQAKTLANNAGVGYNKGVSDADNRVNTSSASYSSGYTNGAKDKQATNRYKEVVVGFVVQGGALYGTWLLKSNGSISSVGGNGTMSGSWLKLNISGNGPQSIIALRDGYYVTSNNYNRTYYPAGTTLISINETVSKAFAAAID